jgi:hypothetical protein
MPPLTADELAAVLRGADPETVAGFVADLQAARGRPVEREEGPAFTLGDGRERVVVPGGDADPGAADVVVRAWSDVGGGGQAGAIDGDGGSQARTIGAADLVDTLLYAVDRSTAERLLGRWFDRSLDDFDGAAGTVTDAQGARPGTHSGSRTAGDRPAQERSSRHGAPGTTTAGTDRRNDGQSGGSPGEQRIASLDARTPDVDPGLLVTVFVLLAVGAVVAWSVGALPAMGGVGPGEVTTETGTGPPAGGTTSGPAAESADALGSTPADQPQVSRPDTQRAVLPPGVDDSGNIDEARLLQAHRALLANRSYRVTLTYREFVDGRQTGAFVQAVRVENRTAYEATSRQFGTLASAPPRLDDQYTGGRRIQSSGDDEVQSVDRDAEDPFLEDVVRYMGYYLSVDESAIADIRTAGGETTVWLVTRGDPWPGVVNTTGSTVVTESGLVRMVRREYDEPDSPVHAVVTIRVSDVGRANVTAPGLRAGGTPSSSRPTSRPRPVRRRS